MAFDRYINRRKLFKQMKDSFRVDIDPFREFRKRARNEFFYIIFKFCYLLCYIFSFSGKVFKVRKEKGVLRKTLMEMGKEGSNSFSILFISFGLSQRGFHFGS